MDEATGYDAARRCALMLVAQIGQAVGGDWSRVDRIVKIGVFVNSVPGFTAQPKVANGASELLEQLFVDAGRHSRSAVGVAALPLGAAVEIDAIVPGKPASRLRWPCTDRPRARSGSEICTGSWRGRGCPYG